MKERSQQVSARITGALFLVATATYATGNGLVLSVLNGSDSVNEARLGIGVLLMMINSAAVIGIGVLFLPVLRRHDESIALIYLGTRLVESILLLVGEIALLLPIHFQTLGAVALKGNFLAYQTAMAALGVGSLLFCRLLYRAKLVPRVLAAWGFGGYVALLISAVLGILGREVSMLWYVPGGLFEVALPIWLFVRGFGSPRPEGSAAMAAHPG